MSAKHPIVAITGSSGAGSPVITSAVKHVLERQGARYVLVDGDGFHRYDRAEFPRMVKEAEQQGRKLSHFSPEANMLDMLESLMKEFGESGRGMHRRYVHDETDAQETGEKEGTLTAWESVPEDTDILVYEGLHGCFKSDTVNVAKYMDLRIGVVPILNLEWIQKIHRDTRDRGYSTEAVMATVERRLADYVHYIAPQFSCTDVNFQRIPMVDTSNPFERQPQPTLNESKVVIHFQDPKKLPCTFPELLNKIPGSFMSRRNTLVIPGSELELGMQVVLEPHVEELLSRRR